MIQRIQTIYLVLAALILGLTFAFPFATYTLGQTDVIFNAYGVSENAGEVISASTAPVCIMYFIYLSQIHSKLEGNSRWSSVYQKKR